MPRLDLKQLETLGKLYTKVGEKLGVYMMDIAHSKPGDRKKAFEILKTAVLELDRELSKYRGYENLSDKDAMLKILPKEQQGLFKLGFDNRLFCRDIEKFGMSISKNGASSAIGNSGYQTAYNQFSELLANNELPQSDSDEIASLSLLYVQLGKQLDAYVLLDYKDRNTHEKNIQETLQAIDSVYQKFQKFGYFYSFKEDDLLKFVPKEAQGFLKFALRNQLSCRELEGMSDLQKSPGYNNIIKSHYSLSKTGELNNGITSPKHYIVKLGAHCGNFSDQLTTRASFTLFSANSPEGKFKHQINPCLTAYNFFKPELDAEWNIKLESFFTESQRTAALTQFKDSKYPYTNYYNTHSGEKQFQLEQKGGTSKVDFEGERDQYTYKDLPEDNRVSEQFSVGSKIAEEANKTSGFDKEAVLTMINVAQPFTPQV